MDTNETANSQTAGAPPTAGSHQSSSSGIRRRRKSAGLLDTARIVALEGELKKIEQVLLPQLYSDIGDACRQRGIGVDSCAREFQEFDRLAREIEAIDHEESQLEKTEGQERHTLAGKAIGVADGLKRRATRDRRSKEQGALLSKIGESCHKAGELPGGEFGAEIAELKRLGDSAASVRTELVSLRRTVPWYAARPRQTAAIVALLVVLSVVTWWGWQFFRDRHRASDLNASLFGASNEIAAKQAELDRLTQESWQQANADAQAQLQMAALNDMENQKQALTNLNQERSQLAGRDQENQQSLARFAENTFSDCDPKTWVQVASARVRQSPMEIKGQNSAQIITALTNKSYLALIGLLNGTTYTEYPSADVISEARDNLDNYAFKILISTGSTAVTTPAGEQLTLICLKPIDRIDNIVYSPISVSRSWKADPSGRGVYVDWSPGQGQAIVALLKARALDQQLESFRSQISSDIKAIRGQVDLGDLSPQLAEERARLKVAERYQSLAHWVASQP